MNTLMKCQCFFLVLFFSFFIHGETNLSKILKTYDIAGGSYALYQNDMLSYVSEGTISLHSVVPINKHTLFRIGTLTTLFTSHVLAQLCLEHRVQPDDPVSKFLSRRQTLPKCGLREITLMDLATHTSGLPSNAFITSQPALLQSRALYSFLNNHRLENPPGQKVEFSPVGYVLLNAVLSRASKEPMAALIDKIVCKKLGMEDTRYTITRSMEQTVSLGHYRQHLVPPKEQENRGSAFYDALGLYSSTFDLGQLLSFYLSESTTTEPLRNILFQSEESPMGLRVKDKVRGQYELASTLMGYSGYFFYDKKSKKGLVLLLNREGVPIERIGRELFTAL